MPARPPLAEAARVVLTLTSDEEAGGHEANNIFYLNVGAIPMTAANLGSLASSIRTQWVNHVKPQTNVEWNLVSTVLSSIDGTETQGAYVGSDAGTFGTNPVPPSLAACISWGQSLAYRGGHPRTYMPGLDETHLVNTGSNLLQSTSANNIQAAWANFLTGVNAIAIGGVSPVMGTVSYYRAKALRATPLFVPYIGNKVNTRLASQRKRLGKLSAGTYL